jgi:hypothetical protein
MKTRLAVASLIVVAGLLRLVAAPEKEKLYLDPIHTEIPHISTDKSVRYDYDIVYVRALRAGDKVHKRFYTDFSQPVTMEPGADLVLLHPDGTEELLVAGGDGSVTDPVVSFDAEWVYYTLIYNLKNYNQWNPPRQGADIYKIHLKTRKIVRLTNQRYSPNTGAAPWSSDFRKQEEGKSYPRCPAAGWPSPATATASARRTATRPWRSSSSSWTTATPAWPMTRTRPT